MKLLPATKVALKFVAICALAYGGWRGYAAYRLSGVQFDPIKPDAVSLIAVTPGPGFRIIVANQVAQLAETPGADFASTGAGDESYDSGIKRRVPIREMLLALAGDATALSKFVAVMNDIKEDDLPPVRKIWRAEDLEKVLNGDAVMQAALERDLNVRLDGTPLPNFTLQAIENGIVIDVPVPVHVAGVPGGSLVARVLRPFRPSFTKDISDQIKESAADTQIDKVRGFYKQRFDALMSDPTSKQDLRKDLMAAIDPATVEAYAKKPEKLLAETNVIVNSTHIKSASYERSSGSNRQTFFNLRLGLTDSGRDRLWKYSHDRQGFQLLFVVDGIAIAAPRITHEMWQSDVLINQLPDEILVRDAVDTITRLSTKGTTRS